MNGRMFDPSDTYPDTYLDTYLDTYPDTYPHSVPFVKSPALRILPRNILRNIPRNIPPKYTSIQTCFFDHGLAGNTHIYDELKSSNWHPVVTMFLAFMDYNISAEELSC